MCSHLVDVQERLTEAYGLSDSQIKADACPIENHDKCYYLTYKYTQDTHDYVAAGYLIYEEGTILILTEAGYGSDERTIKAELLEMAQTVNYTGNYHLPKEDEYPFTVENPYVHVAVSAGFDSPQAADVRNQEKDLYTTDSKKIIIRYTVADDYDKGMISLFSVEYLDSDASVDKQADSLYESYQDSDVFEDSSLEELKIDEVWSDTFAVTAYRVCVHRQETNYSVERYFFQIGEKSSTSELLIHLKILRQEMNCIKYFMISTFCEISQNRFLVKGGIKLGFGGTVAGMIYLIINTTVPFYVFGLYCYFKLSFVQVIRCRTWPDRNNSNRHNLVP